MYNLNNTVLFMTYVCVADGFLDDKEVQSIQKFLEDYKLPEETQEQVKKILGDTEDKPSLNQVIQEFKNLGYTEQKEALISGLNIAYVDGFFDPAEEKLFQEFIDKTGFPYEEYLNLKKDIQELSEKNKNQTIFFEESIQDVIVKNFLFLAKNFTTGSIRENLEKEYTKFLLKGKEYANAVQALSKLAQVDLSILKQKLKEIDTKNESLLQDINKVLNQNQKYKKSQQKEQQEFYEILYNLQLGLKDVIQKQREHNKRTLTKKERALNFYTISFLGKTKAGKSTLHSILTGKGEEFIGKGQQRTTRYNRMYEWNGIRIVDTPGIGAPGGKTDEEIAKSVLDESDLICYVLKNDSVQESEFQFLKYIKEQNKPIVILLNVKENLENETKLKLYLKDPEKWYTRTDEKSLQGHINRIRRYAQEHYKNNYFEIYPVLLLAAKMSRDEKYSMYQDVLYKSSHLEDFLNALKIQILEEGFIRRSQTILDGTIYTLLEDLEKLNNHSTSLQKLKDKIIKNKKETLSKLEYGFEETYDLLKRDLQNLFEDLKEREARSFASRYYDEDEDEINYLWSKRLKEINFNEKIKSKVENVSSTYYAIVKEAFQEIEENLNLFSKLEFKHIQFELEGSFFSKSFVKLMGNIIGAVGLAVAFFTPIGWIGAALGGIVSFFSSFFESKREKIQKATEKLHSAIKRSIEQNQSQVVSKILDNFQAQHEEVKTRFLSSIQNLEETIQIVLDQIQPVLHKLQNSIEELNKIYAYRIIKYLKKEKELEIDFNQISQIQVKREYGKKMKIQSPYKFSKEQEEKISNILQEQIEFIKLEGNSYDRKF